jgi:hypothetical protein
LLALWVRKEESLFGFVEVSAVLWGMKDEWKIEEGEGLSTVGRFLHGKMAVGSTANNFTNW